MKLLWWRKGRADVERAKLKDEQAGQHLDSARQSVEDARREWPETLEHRRKTDRILQEGLQDGLTRRFLKELHNGGHA